MRCPITSYGDQVPAPSVASTHLSGKSLSNAVRLAGVRSRIATASSSLSRSSLIEGILLAEDSEAHVSIRSSGPMSELTRRREFNSSFRVHHSSLHSRSRRSRRTIYYAPGGKFLGAQPA